MRLNLLLDHNGLRYSVSPLRLRRSSPILGTKAFSAEGAFFVLRHTDMSASRLMLVVHDEIICVIPNLPKLPNLTAKTLTTVRILRDRSHKQALLATIAHCSLLITN